MAPSFDDNQPIPSRHRHVVAIPYPGRGHINPMLSLCTAVAERSSDVVITFVLTEEWVGLLASVKTPPNMSFAAIPNVLPSEKDRGDDFAAFFMAVLTKMEAPLERLLNSGDLATPPDFIIGDAVVPWVSEVAGRRNIPIAHLWAMSASVYTVFYHFDLLVQNGHFPVDLSVNGEAIVDYIPGLSPVRVTELPEIVRHEESLRNFLQALPNDSNAKHLIFNSLYELEPQVLDDLKQKSSMAIYNIGPSTTYFKLRAIKMNSTTTHDNHYLTWLELQPPSSVLFISLGSFLHASSAQMDEIAVAMQGSGVRFLWVAKRGMSHLQQKAGDKGLLVEWCDQVRVLAHPSVGGFLSHCGWNSTKEAVLAGVPVLALPMLMDQFPNTKAIADDWRLGWRMFEGGFKNKEELIKSDKVGEMVKRFMDLGSEEREEISRNAREMKIKCEREFAAGDSYETNVDAFVNSIMQL